MEKLCFYNFNFLIFFKYYYPIYSNLNKFFFLFFQNNRINKNFFYCFGKIRTTNKVLYQSNTLNNNIIYRTFFYYKNNVIIKTNF